MLYVQNVINTYLLTKLILSHLLLPKRHDETQKEETPLSPVHILVL